MLIVYVEGRMGQSIIYEAYAKLFLSMYTALLGVLGGYKGEREKNQH